MNSVIIVLQTRKANCFADFKDGVSDVIPNRSVLYLTFACRKIIYEHNSRLVDFRYMDGHDRSIRCCRIINARLFLWSGCVILESGCLIMWSGCLIMGSGFLIL
jgi:hypothetical protein